MVLSYLIEVIIFAQNLLTTAFFVYILKSEGRWRLHAFLALNPSSACSFGVNEDFVRKDLQKVMDIFDENHCVWDVTLKDPETTGGDPTAIVRWTSITREELEKHYG